MSALNAALASATDLVLRPFSTLHPLAGLAVVSLVTAIAMLVVFKRTSNQVELNAVKRSIHAGIFEIRLYNDDMRAIARAQRDILRDNARYLWLSIVPMAWMMVPLVLLIAQLQFHYGYAELMPGDRPLLKAHLRAGASGPVAIEAPSGLRLDTSTVYFPAAREFVWRLAPVQPGHQHVRLIVGSHEYVKTVQVGGGVVRRSPARLENTWLNQLLYPSEPPLPGDGPIDAITVGYAPRNLSVFGRDLHWMIVYFALSLIFAFALRRRFGVTI